MRREIIRTIETLLALITLMVGFYPTVSDAWNQIAASRMISQYEDQIADISGTNNTEEGKIVTDENGVMGYLEIPSISVTLPIYEGTSDEVLAKGVGHASSSSLPVGGESTHTVLTGHRGLPSAKLFTDLNLLKEGDRFTIHTSGKRLVYEVMDIRTVLPDETESLEIVEGQDLATLVTCTPYGVNTHRLLVTGKRVADIDTMEYKDWNLRSIWNEGTISRLKPILILVCAGLAMAAAVLRILWLWKIDWPRRKRRIRRMKYRKEMHGGEMEEANT